MDFEPKPQVPNEYKPEPQVEPARPVVQDFAPVAPIVPDVPAPPVAAAPTQTLASVTPTAPVAVVRVLSPVGVEYVFMTVSLFGGVLGLVFALLAVVNGQTDFSVLAFPVALLLTSVPTFAALFLHLKKLEIAQPALQLDPSKRRSTQFTQIVSYITCFFTVVGVIFSLFTKMSGDSGPSIVKTLLDGLVILLVFGGVLFYYWRNEHRG